MTFWTMADCMKVGCGVVFEMRAGQVGNRLREERFGGISRRDGRFILVTLGIVTDPVTLALRLALRWGAFRPGELDDFVVDVTFPQRRGPTAVDVTLLLYEISTWLRSAGKSQQPSATSWPDAPHDAVQAFDLPSRDSRAPAGRRQTPCARRAARSEVAACTWKCPGDRKRDLKRMSFSDD